MCGFSLSMIRAGTLGVPRRHWDMRFAGNALGYDFHGTVWLMMSLMGICGLAAIVRAGLPLAPQRPARGYAAGRAGCHRPATGRDRDCGNAVAADDGTP
jgi:hypothetical protein